MQNATEGTIKETTYWWPRPGADEPFEKKTFCCVEVLPPSMVLKTSVG